MIHDGPLIHIGIAIAAGTIAAVIFYFKGKADGRQAERTRRVEETTSNYNEL